MKSKCAWWVAHKRVDCYILSEDIDNIPKFKVLHDLMGMYDEAMEQTNNINKVELYSWEKKDGSYDISVNKNGKIDGVTCNTKFLLEDINIISHHKSFMLNLLRKNFIEKDIQYIEGDRILYENGDVQYDLDFDEIGLIVTLDDDEIIKSVSVLNMENVLSQSLNPMAFPQ